MPGICGSGLWVPRVLPLSPSSGSCCPGPRGRSRSYGTSPHSYCRGRIRTSPRHPGCCLRRPLASPPGPGRSPRVSPCGQKDRLKSEPCQPPEAPRALPSPPRQMPLFPGPRARRRLSWPGWLVSGAAALWLRAEAAYSGPSGYDVTGWSMRTL